MAAKAQPRGTGVYRMIKNSIKARMPTCRPEIARRWMVPVVRNTSFRSASSSSRRPSKTAAASSACDGSRNCRNTRFPFARSRSRNRPTPHQLPGAIIETHCGTSARKLLRIRSERNQVARSNEPGLNGTEGAESRAKQRSRSPASTFGGSPYTSNVARPETGRHSAPSRNAIRSTSRRDPLRVDHDSTEGGSSRGRSTATASKHAGSALRRAKRPRSSAANRFHRQWCHAPAADATANSNATLPASETRKSDVETSRVGAAGKSRQYNCRPNRIAIQAASQTAASTHHASTRSGQ